MSPPATRDAGWDVGKPLWIEFVDEGIGLSLEKCLEGSTKVSGMLARPGHAEFNWLE